YRWAARRNLSLDVAGFFNVYDHLETTEPLLPFVETSPPPPHLVLPQRFDNLLKGETYGVEVAANWAIASRWDVSAAYSRLKILLHRDSRSQMTTAEQAEGASPGHQFHLRSHWRLPYNLEFDASLHHTSSLPSLEVPAYNRVDAQWTWNPVESASISTGGQNLLSRRHREFGNFRQVGRIGQAERNFYVKLRWHF
ncbi:MAG TPA: TonB-dependent receptor, partial [Terriglobia bacterium]|nr:TonB-dependent receptor [Terriglobia bacterium]